MFTLTSAMLLYVYKIYGNVHELWSLDNISAILLRHNLEEEVINVPNTAHKNTHHTFAIGFREQEIPSVRLITQT